MRDETPFELAIRRTRENEARILRQRALIARLDEIGQDGILHEARRLLGMMEANQRLFSEQLRAVFDVPVGRRRI